MLSLLWQLVLTDIPARPILGINGRLFLMKATTLIFVLSGLVLAPLAVAVTAFFSGLWQSTAEPYMMNEEELGI